MLRNISNLTGGVMRELPKAVPAYLILLIPKCSLCLSAYLNIFTLLGISVSGYASWILPLFTILMVVSLFISYQKARKLNDFRAFLLSCLGTTILLISKLWIINVLLGCLALILILAAAVVQVVQSRRVCSQDLLRQKRETIFL